MKYYLYTHIGSGNRGCEATARSIKEMLNLDKASMYVFSEDKTEEKDCNTEMYATVCYTPVVSGFKPISSIIPRVLTKYGIDALASVKYRYKKLFDNIASEDVGLSTGGDVFCYNQELADKIGYLTGKMKKKGNKVCLMACSMDKKHLTKKTVEILSMFDYIFPRESLTEKNLRDIGLDNIKLYPDPAFVLPRECVAQEVFSDEIDYVGINYSSYTNRGHDTGENYQTVVKFIRNILDTTSMSVVLIPHVFWKLENDLQLLEKIKNVFKEEERVILIKNHYSSAQMKYIISKCRFFIGSRTHSVIGAYSSGVPTLAVGYSIKSKGIAKDIFGDYENYVIDSEKLNDYDAFVNAFQYIVDHEADIRCVLKDKNIEFTNQLKEQAEFIKTL